MTPIAHPQVTQPFLSRAQLETELQRWRAAVLSDPKARWDESQDLAYWQQVAPRYEAARLPLPNTLAQLRGLLRPDWTLLDAGAGTGRLARPLAGAVQSLTALDYSAAMLEQFARLGVPPNVTLRQGRFEDKDLPIHGAVLCAWALYRSADLRKAVGRLGQLSSQRLLILEDNGLPTPHTRWRRPQARQVPRTTLLEALLRERWPVRVYQVQESHSQEFASPEALLAHYHVPEMQAKNVLAEVSPYLHPGGAGWHYHYPYTVTLLAAQTGDNSQ